MKSSYVDFIQKSGLINVLDHNDLLLLIDNSELLKFDPGEIIFNQGEDADGVFLIISGHVQIIAGCSHAMIVLAKLGQGDYFGEQALIKESKRTAGARAYDQVEVLKISKHQFLEVVQKRKETLAKHLEAGAAQEITRHIFTELPGIKQSVSESADRFECTFNDDDIIFKEGDEPDGIYWILQGAVDILKEESGRQILNNTLRVGSVFGELAVIKGGLRAATVKARSKLRVLFISKEILLKSANIEQLETYFSGFLRSYQLTQNRGLITQRVKFSDKDNSIVETKYTLNDGRIYSAELCAVENHFSLEKVEPIDQSTEPLAVFSYQNNTDQREIHLSSDGFIFKLIHIGDDWPQLQELIQLTLEGKHFLEEHFEQFSSNGTVSEEITGVSSAPVESHDHSEVICKCMNVTRGAILDAVDSGANTFQTVKTQLGCATVCGVCKPRVMELVGKDLWQKAKLIKTIPLTPTIQSFQFVPEKEHCFPARPGQHIFIRTNINGVMVERPYTLTSVTDDQYYEISVKKEEKGLFSNWLFENQGVNKDFELTSPQGDCAWDEESPEPVVCFVAGIGITPAIAILRRKAKEKNPVKLTIHLSVSNTSENAFMQELEEANQLPNTTVIIRETSKEGRLTEEAIEQIRVKNSTAQFFLCGPVAFNAKVKSFLSEKGVHKGKIQLDYFEVQGDSPEVSIPFEDAVRPSYAPNRRLLIGHTKNLYDETMSSYILNHYKEWEDVQSLQIFLKRCTIIKNPKDFNLLVERPELFSQEITFSGSVKASRSKRIIISHDGPEHMCLRKAIEPNFQADLINGQSITRIITAAKTYCERLKVGTLLDPNDLRDLSITAGFSALHGFLPSDEEVYLGRKMVDATNLSYTVLFPSVTLFWIPQFYRARNNFHRLITQKFESVGNSSPLIQMLKQAKDFDGVSFADKDDVIRAAYAIPLLFGGEFFSQFVATALYAIFHDKELLEACRIESEQFLSADSEERNTKMIPHIRAAVLESVRRYPYVPGIFVTSKKNFVLRKYKILRNDYLLFATSLANFSEDLYEDPFEYKWQRYFNCDEDKLFPNGSFGYGEHACLAKRIIPEMLCVLCAYFLDNFEFELLTSEFKFGCISSYFAKSEKNMKVSRILNK